MNKKRPVLLLLLYCRRTLSNSYKVQGLLQRIPHSKGRPTPSPAISLLSVVLSYLPEPVLRLADMWALHVLILVVTCHKGLTSDRAWIVARPNTANFVEKVCLGVHGAKHSKSILHYVSLLPRSKTCSSRQGRGLSIRDLHSPLGELSKSWKAAL